MCFIGVHLPDPSLRLTLEQSEGLAVKRSLGTRVHVSRCPHLSQASFEAKTLVPKNPFESLQFSLGDISLSVLHGRTQEALDAGQVPIPQCLRDSFCQNSFIGCLVLGKTRYFLGLERNGTLLQRHR